MYLHAGWDTETLLKETVHGSRLTSGKWVFTIEVDVVFGMQRFLGSIAGAR